MPAPIADIITKIMAALPASWRTSTAGYVGLAVVVVMTAMALRKDREPDWNVVVGLTVTSLGLISARDNKVTSKQAGAEP